MDQHRKQKYKEELDREVNMKKMNKSLEKQQEYETVQKMFDNQRRNEELRNKVQRDKREVQISYSMDNLNQQLVSKKLQKERNYQKTRIEDDNLTHNKMYLQQYDEQVKQNQDQAKQDLRKTYENMIRERQANQMREKQQQQNQEMDMLNNMHQRENLRNKNLYQQKEKNLQKILSNQNQEHNNMKLEDLYHNELDLQLQQKHHEQMIRNDKKRQERLQIEEKLKQEREQKMMKKQEELTKHKQLEEENRRILENQQRKKQEKHLMDQKEMTLNWYEIQNRKVKLPHIYCENYLPQERTKQLAYIDRDLEKQSQMKFHNPMIQTTKYNQQSDRHSEQLDQPIQTLPHSSLENHGTVSSVKSYSSIRKSESHQSQPERRSQIGSSHNSNQIINQQEPSIHSSQKQVIEQPRFEEKSIQVKPVKQAPFMLQQKEIYKQQISDYNYIRSNQARHGFNIITGL